MRLRQGARTLSLVGTVRLHWLPAPEIRFEGEQQKGPPDLIVGKADFTTGAGGLRGRALVLQHQIFSGRFSGLLNGRAFRGPRRRVREAGFQLLNFSKYVGKPIRRERHDGVLVTRARLTFETADVTVTLDQAVDSPDEFRRIRLEGGFLTTHVGSVVAHSGRSMSFDEVDILHGRLRLFFAFLAGQWTGPVLMTGNGRDRPIWTEYSNWVVTPSRVARSWLPAQVAEDVTGLLRPFTELHSRQPWGDAIRTLVYWYVEANAQSSTLESSLTAAAIPLELLAWMVLVVDGSHLSRRKYKQMAASERLEAMLQHLGIPMTIPDHFPALAESDLAKEKPTGPACIFHVRNSLVHPRKSRATHALVREKRAFLELKELALSYVELGFLRALGYQGHYARRMLDGWRGQELELVPWANN
ncbi:MAG: hypothetical protein WD942_10670 [Dehalococcoidia bacterium]